MERLLVLNCGSASLKYKLYRATDRGPQAESAGHLPARGDHERLVAEVLRRIACTPDAIAHRVVHGGPRLRDPVLLDGAVEDEIRRAAELAPLHDRYALAGIEATRALGVPMVAVFDTAFHRTLPEHAWRYPLPAEVGDEVRRYGFHGLSHAYVAERYAELSQTAAPTLISLHLGGGASAAAIRRGASVETSMGFTPLEGLMMGTRSGDLDPMVPLHLLRRGRTPDEIERLLNLESGLRAIAGTDDVRQLLARRDPDAELALDLFAYRVRKCIGAYLAVLEGETEAIVFTGGIGENAADVRRRCVSGLEWAGVRLDEARNAAAENPISADGSRVALWVIPTDEEIVIARAACALLARR